MNHEHSHNYISQPAQVHCAAMTITVFSLLDTTRLLLIFSTCVPDYNVWTCMYLCFQSKLLMNLLIFATVHSLMKDLNLIHSCQANLPVQYTSNIKLIHHKWHLVLWLTASHTGVTRRASLILQETRSFHDSMNISKIEFMSKVHTCHFWG